MRSEPYHDELCTFRGDTKQRRHRRNGGSSCAKDERRFGHDMMMSRGCQYDDCHEETALVIDIYFNRSI